MMDAVVGEIIAYLLKLYLFSKNPNIRQPHGMAVTAHIPANTRVNIFESLGDMIIEEDVKSKLKQLVRACRRHFDHRDHIAHSFWAFDENDQPVAAKYTAKKRLKAEHRPMSTSLLKQWADEAQEAMFELNGFLELQRQIAFRELREELIQQESQH